MTTATMTARPSAPVRHAPLPAGQEKREAPATWWQTEEPREQVLERTLALPFTADSDANLRTRHRGLIKLLDWLEDQPGRTWQERWMASGAEEAGREWTRVPMQWLADRQRARKYDRADLCCGMIPLLGGQVVRPAYRWLLRQRPSQLLTHIRSVTDPDGFAALKDQYTATGHAGSNDCKNALNRVTWIVASKGGTVHDVTIGDCVELQHAIGEHQTNGYHGKHLFYALLAGLGVFGPDAPARLKTVMLPGQLTPAALVDRQGITCTAIRDLLVDYLTERAVDVDYTTLEDMARTLAGLFWRDLEKHHPGIDSLRLDADIVTAWRERVRMVRDRHGTPIRPRVNAHTVFSWVRTFYQDLARWAVDEPTRWGPWVAPCPVRDSDTDHSKNRARRKAAMDQRTRTLLPALPSLVKAVERQLKDAQTCLATGRETPAGVPFTTPAGETLLRRAGVSSRVYADDPATGRRRDLTVEEERAFWAWAIVEVLRHTGMRIEEALELTHHSFVAYQLPTTGEIVPMLQVAPSKLDQERLLLVSPELGEVLTAIIYRVRRGQQAMPLVSAYDSLERLWSAPMPFLFQRRCGPEDRAIPRNYIYTCLNDAIAASGLTGPGDEQLRYTPHDFRRIFVTDALRSGLPPHIAARICGHRTVDTTLGYAAIYPEDVINTGPSSPAAGRCDPGRSTASRPRRSGRTSWPTSSCGRSPSASAHATSAPPASMNTPASAALSCGPIPSRCPAWRRSTRTCSTGSRRPRNRDGSARSPRSRPASPPPSRSSPPCATSRPGTPPSTWACLISVASSRASTPSSKTRMRRGSPEHYNEGMTVFLCSKCGTAITPELAELAAVPDVSDDERDRDKETRRAPSTVPRGHYAIDPEPWGQPYVVQDDQEDPKPAQSRGPVVCREEGFVISAGSRHTVLVHPDDAAGLQPLPNWENSSGCCGPTGDEGLNRACPCGAPVATLAADCFGPFELHLDPVRTYAFSQ
ncbi:tyrosine-type recombinase/integrase [Streptomyces sp. SCL15-6]|uniref:tyrosine-type recombinase/integrase n=1 Tax=Streptomyces sp. SCL15-6 TaxID=2967222 RepID=UPI0029663F37|nr:tyrosine-type recombinase/integrase [Streptomyces sp. SCL15-6]